MENFNDLVQKRRSTRQFTGEKLSQDQVVALMKAALMSPSSKRCTPWQFIAVDDAETLQALAQCRAQNATFIAGAALAVVVVADPLATDVWIEDAAIAAIMLQLQAEDLGLGSCWAQVRERTTASGQPSGEYIRELLNIPLPLQVLSVVAVGYKATERKPFDQEHLQWEKVHINKFGEK